MLAIAIVLPYSKSHGRKVFLKLNNVLSTFLFSVIGHQIHDKELYRAEDIINIYFTFVWQLVIIIFCAGVFWSINLCITDPYIKQHRKPNVSMIKDILVP